MNTNIYLHVDLQGLSNTLTELHNDIDQYLTDERGLHQLFLDSNKPIGSGKVTATLEESVFSTLGMDRDWILERLNDIRDQITCQDKNKGWYLKKVELLSLCELLTFAGDTYSRLKEFTDRFDIDDNGKKFKSWVNQCSEGYEEENQSYETKVVFALDPLAKDLMRNVDDFLTCANCMAKAGLIKELDRE